MTRLKPELCAPCYPLQGQRQFRQCRAENLKMSLQSASWAEVENEDAKGMEMGMRLSTVTLICTASTSLMVHDVGHPLSWLSSAIAPYDEEPGQQLVDPG